MIAQQINRILDKYPTASISVVAKPQSGNIPARVCFSVTVGDVLWQEAPANHPVTDDVVARALEGICDGFDRGCQLPGVQEKLDAHLASTG